MPPETTFHYTLLGPLQIEAGGRPLAQPSYLKARALLVYLLLEPGPHTREFLADLLWPDEDAAAGRDNLRRMLSLLRPLLPAEGLDASRQAVALAGTARAAMAVDAWQLLQAAAAGDSLTGPATAELSAAVPGWKNELLFGFSLPACTDFNDWLEQQREHYRRALSQVLQVLARRSESSGDWRTAAAHLNRLTELVPWDDAAWRALIELQLRQGRRDAAVEAFERYRQVLSDDLGVEPDPALAALVQGGQGFPMVEQPAPERRLLTVVVCELLAFGGDERTEADEEAAVQRQLAAATRCAERLREAGGYVKLQTGSSLTAYFGYPMTREDVARQALGGAQACVALGGPDLAVRVGCHSGMALTAPDSDLPDSAGQLTQVAVRIAERADWGEVVVSASLLRLLKAPAAALRGELADRPNARAMALYAIQAPVDKRFSHGSGAGSFVGRQALQAQLLAAMDGLRAAPQAAGQCWLLQGEAGSGKSRLASELQRNAGVPVLELQCLPELADAPFHPLLRWLAALERSEQGGGLGTASQWLADFTASLDGPQRLVFTGLLGRATAADAEQVRHWPHGQWRETANEVLTRLLVEATPPGSLLLAEDLHWADPSTATLLARLAQDPPAGRLLLATARPEYPPAAGMQVLRIEPLADADAAALVRAVAEPALSAPLLDRVVALGGGLPLFLQELARSLAERRPAEAGVLPSAFDLPETLQDLLMARIDAAGPFKPVAQRAAAIGTDVPVPLLATVMARPPDEIRAACTGLAERGILNSHGADFFSFRHALLRQAAYQSLPRSARRDAHARIIEALLARDPDLAEQEPALLAWHAEEAETWPDAIRYHAAAGSRATERSAYEEAIRHQRSALALLKHLPADAARDRLEMELQLGLGLPLQAHSGYGAPEAAVAFRAALALAAPFGDDPQLIPLYWGMWLGSSSWADFNESIRLSNVLIRLGGKQPDPVLLAHGYYALGNSLFSVGDFAGAVTALESCVAVYPAQGGHQQLGEDALVTGLSFLSWGYWFVGRHDEALAASRRALAYARAIGHPYSLGYACIFGAILHRLRREIEPAAALGAEAEELAKRYGMALWTAAGQTFRGWARIARGDPAGFEDIFGSLHLLQRVTIGIESLFLAHLLDACRLANAADYGLQAIEAGLRSAEVRLDRHFIAEFQRMKGEFLLLQPAPGTTREDIHTLFRDAWNTARTMGSPSLALRAATSIARHVDREEGARCIRVALQDIRGGEETLDLIEARALLEEVAALQ